MAPHANQSWSTEAGTRPRVGVTFAFMGPPHHFVGLYEGKSPWAFCHSPYSVGSLVLVVFHVFLLWTLSRSLLTSVGHLTQFPFHQCCSSSLVFASLPQFLLQSLHHAQRAWKTQKRAIVLQLYVRRNRPDPSQPSPPTASSPGRGQNWTESPLPSPHAQHSPPPLSDTMHDSGSFPVDEEIPPLELQPLEAPPEPCIITRPQARPLEQGSCMVEEEIPPSWLTEWIARNTTPGLDMEEIPPTAFDMDTTPHADTDGKIEQPLPNPHHFSDDHLQLIFDMRRSLEDQTHNQSILSRRMDLLFDSLSDVPEKTRCRPADKGSSSPTTLMDARVCQISSFSLFLHIRNQLQLFSVLLNFLMYGNNHGRYILWCMTPDTSYV
jgi:hypothetical protein